MCVLENWESTYGRRPKHFVDTVWQMSCSQEKAKARKASCIYLHGAFSHSTVKKDLNRGVQETIYKPFQCSNDSGKGLPLHTGMKASIEKEKSGRMK